MPGLQKIQQLSARMSAHTPSVDILNFCEHYYGLQIDYLHEFYEEIGGDMWGVYPFSREEVFFYLFDFLGHDAKAAHRALSLHGMTQRALTECSNTSAILSWLNDQLRASPIFPAYVSMCLGFYHRHTHQIRCANASGPPMYRLSSQKGVEDITTLSLPLGARAGTGYDENSFIFEAGDQLLLYSDALIESRTTTSDAFYQTFLTGLLEDYIHGPHTRSLHRTVTSHFFSKCGHEIDDDLTILTLHRPLNAPVPINKNKAHRT